MKRRTGTRRTLRAESLESRQLLHGGGMAGGGEPPTTEERVESAFERFDANEDMELSQDEVSERLWNRMSAADGDDENTTVSAEELTVHLDAQAAERAENGGGERGERRDRGNRVRGDRGGERLSVEERIDTFFAEHDTNEDGVITADDDVSEHLLERIATADADGDGVSAADLLARHEQRQQERFEAKFAALDENGDGGITADEVSERRWERISAADGEEGDGIVTSDELKTYLDAQRAEREAERDANDGDEVGDNSADAETVAATEARGQQRRVRRGRR